MAGGDVDTFGGLPPDEQTLLSTEDAVARAAAEALGPGLLDHARAEGHDQWLLAPTTWPRVAATRAARQRALLHLLAAHPQEAGRLGHVQALRIAGHELPPPLAGLAALPALERLWLHGVRVDESFRAPHLQLLSITEGTGTLDLGDAPLRHLSLLRSSIVLRGQRHPHLEVLAGGFVTVVPDVEMPALREAVFLVDGEFDLRGCPKVESLTLRGEGVVTGLPALTHLTALTSSVPLAPDQLRLPALERVQLRNETLAGLPAGGLPSLRFANFAQTALRDVDGLGAAAPALEELDVSRCRALVDLSGIADHPTLRILDLQHSKKAHPSALGALPSLERLQLGSTPWKARDVPASLHPVTLPRSKVGRTRKKKKPSTAKAPKPRGGATGRQVGRLRKMLVSRELATIQQGVELAAPLGAEVFDALLEGTELTRGERDLRVFGRPLRCAFDRFVPNRTFAYRSSQTGPHREAALRALVAAAVRIGGIGAGLADRIEALWLDARVGKEKVARIDLAPLARLPNLRTLAIERGFPLHAPEALADFPALETLYFGITSGSLGPLVLPPTLRALRVSDRRATDFVGDGASWGALECLDLTGRAGHLRNAGWAPLQGLRALRWVAFADPDYRELAALPALEALDVHNAIDLRFVTELPALRHLVLPHQLHVEALPPLPALEILEVSFASPAGALEACPGLRELRVRGHGSGFDPKPFVDAGVRVRLDEWAGGRVPGRSRDLVEVLA